MSRRMKGLRTRFSISFKDSKTSKKRVIERPAFENLQGQKLHATPRGYVQKNSLKIQMQPRKKKVIPRLTPNENSKTKK